ncbi:MAG: CPBP family glutamic-type intramembrane protease [Planctomycetota bacterium]
MSAAPRPSPAFLLASALAALGGAWLCIEAEAAELITRGAAKHREELLAAGRALRAEAPRFVAAVGPLLFALLVLTHPGARTRVAGLGARRAAGLAAGLTAWTFLLLGLAPARYPAFDPWSFAILVLAAIAVTLTGGELRRTGPGLTGPALLLWLAMWVPFDLRSYRALWLGPPGLDYAVFALWITTLAALAFGALPEDERLGLRLPGLRDLGHGLGWLLAFGALAIPLGLGLGFLKPNVGLDAASTVLAFLGILLTVALPEELFFRGVLDARLQASLPGRPWASLLASSSLFGLMHWNNAGSLRERLAYVFLATIAGGFYGLAYRRSGGLWAAVLAHTLVDVLWKLLLHR